MSEETNQTATDQEREQGSDTDLSTESHQNNPKDNNSVFIIITSYITSHITHYQQISISKFQNTDHQTQNINSKTHSLVYFNP